MLECLLVHHKQDTRDYTEYRDTSMLSSANKILLINILHQLTVHVDEMVRNFQCGLVITDRDGSQVVHSSNSPEGIVLLKGQGSA
jgi:hypothetical protein